VSSYPPVLFILSGGWTIHNSYTCFPDTIAKFPRLVVQPKQEADKENKAIKEKGIGIYNDALNDYNNGNFKEAYRKFENFIYITSQKQSVVWPEELINGANDKTSPMLSEHIFEYIKNNPEDLDLTQDEKLSFLETDFKEFLNESDYKQIATIRVSLMRKDIDDKNIDRAYSIFKELANNERFTSGKYYSGYLEYFASYFYSIVDKSSPSQLKTFVEQFEGTTFAKKAKDKYNVLMKSFNKNASGYCAYTNALYQNEGYNITLSHEDTKLIVTIPMTILSDRNFIENVLEAWGAQGGKSVAFYNLAGKAIIETMDVPEMFIK
jgi:hypothetical protein